MINRKVLDFTGCTAERLRQIFTCDDSTCDDGKIRKRFERDLLSRFQSGFQTSLQHAKIFQAVDIAMDSTPIQDETIPLLLWAQGKIEKKKFVSYFEGQTELAKNFIKKEKGKDGTDQISVDVPRLHEIQVNLIRSYIQRRLATQSARFSNLWPYFKYEPYGTDDVAKLRGDTTSQRVDQMVNQYNYRHFCPQTFRHQFMYARSTVFARSAWDIKYAWRAKDLNVEDPAKMEIESYVEREGLDFVAPHPSRIFRDTAAPLANINTDNGPAWIGYWDIVRWSAIEDGNFFNTKKVTFGENTSSLISKYSPYFNFYYDPCVLKWPDLKPDPTEGNSRVSNIGTYADGDRDKGVLTAQYYVKVNPHHEKIAKYDGDVWIRFTVAGDETIIGAEFLTTIPACYGGLNENDDRLVNPSMATELMPFQDQLSNLFTQLLTTIRTGMMQIWCVDKDALEPDMLKYIEDAMQSKELYTTPQAFFYSGTKLAGLDMQNPSMNPRAFLTVIQAQVLTSIEQIYKAIAEVFNAADKVVMMSPNEQAQPNPREVAAREVTEISSSTTAISSFVSDGIDEQRAAMKKMIFESLVCESTQTFTVPVINRYNVETIKAAGFTLKGKSESAFKDEKEIVPLTTSIIGKPQNLIYEFYFDSRDGAERAVNSQGAQILSQFAGQVFQNEMMLKMLGKRRSMELLNEIIRMSGAAYDLKLDPDEGEDEPTLVDRVAALEQIIQQLKAMMQPAGGAPGLPGVPAGAPPADPAAAGAPPPAEAPPQTDEGTAPSELPPALQGV